MRLTNDGAGMGRDKQPEQEGLLPQRAAAYAPPREVPRETEHRTLEMKRVRIAPEFDWRHQPTLMLRRGPEPVLESPRSRNGLWLYVMLGGLVGAGTWLSVMTGALESVRISSGAALTQTSAWLAERWGSRQETASRALPMRGSSLLGAPSARAVQLPVSGPPPSPLSTSSLLLEQAPTFEFGTSTQTGAASSAIPRAALPAGAGPMAGAPLGAITSALPGNAGPVAHPFSRPVVRPLIRPLGATPAPTSASHAAPLVSQRAWVAPVEQEAWLK